ncbi:hypothetical protein GTW67_03215 [Streptomyces sp. SID5910]|nr:hypothetical protein [Streptomyces sp. SID5910]
MCAGPTPTGVSARARSLSEGPARSRRTVRNPCGARPKHTPRPHPSTAPGPAKPAVPTTPEPAAADGERTPRGPPAPDNATRTGGAGGNTTAEGEAEAETRPPTHPCHPCRNGAIARALGAL